MEISFSTATKRFIARCLAAVVTWGRGHPSLTAATSIYEWIMEDK